MLMSLVVRFWVKCPVLWQHQSMLRHIHRGNVSSGVFMSSKDMRQTSTLVRIKWKILRVTCPRAGERRHGAIIARLHDLCRDFARPLEIPTQIPMIDILQASITAMFLNVVICAEVWKVVPMKPACKYFTSSTI